MKGSTKHHGTYTRGPPVDTVDSPRISQCLISESCCTRHRHTNLVCDFMATGDWDNSPTWHYNTHTHTVIKS